MSSIYPFAEMAVGEIVVMAGRSRGAVTQAAHNYRLKNPKARFRIQNAIGGMAITRLHDRDDEPVTDAKVYLLSQCRQTVVFGPASYAEITAAKPACEKAIGQTLVIVITDEPLGDGILNSTIHA